MKLGSVINFFLLKYLPYNSLAHGLISSSDNVLTEQNFNGISLASVP